MSMQQLKVPRIVIAPALAGLFLLTLLMLRQYAHTGAGELLTLAILAAALTLAIVAGLIHANYNSFRRSQPPQSHNGAA